MQQPLIKPLAYHASPLQLFARLRELPWPMLLDSSGIRNSLGRYDIAVADPAYQLTTRGNATLVIERSGKQLELTGQNPYDIIKKYLQPIQNNSDLPFCGGAVGYLGYDLQTQVIPGDQREGIISMPDMAIGIYEWAVISDHHKQRCYFVSVQSSQVAEQTYQSLLGFQQQPVADRSYQPLCLDHHGLQVDIDFPTYCSDFDKIQRYLADGDCYQVNYARCFNAGYTGSPWASYQRLRQTNPVPFGAFLEFPFATVISASPERFLRVSGNLVETRPIKGTRPRGENAEQDERLAHELQESDKDRAENLMIVDLLRNDLGKTCIPGSIKVPELFTVETFPTLFHLVSTVTGSMAPGYSGLDVLRHCFPGGSITGAPKKRAMEIIQQLEKHKRGIYCGAIGYVSHCGNLDTNIAIRTMALNDRQLCFWAGGGIVADSRAQNEFDETLHKAKAFTRLLGIDQ